MNSDDLVEYVAYCYSMKEMVQEHMGVYSMDKIDTKFITMLVRLCGTTAKYESIEVPKIDSDVDREMIKGFLSWLWILAFIKNWNCDSEEIKVKLWDSCGASLSEEYIKLAHNFINFDLTKVLTSLYKVSYILGLSNEECYKNVNKTLALIALETYFLKRRDK